MGHKQELSPKLKVVVIGPVSAPLVRLLWDTGLRPVRGLDRGAVWAPPNAEWLS